jgi:hypothetical protein
MRVYALIDCVLTGRIDQATARRRGLLIFYIGQNEIELRQRPVKPFDQFSLKQLRQIDV